MEDGVADDDIGEGIVERHVFYVFNTKIRPWKRRSEDPREGADAIDGLRVRVYRVNFVACPEEIDKVSTGAASGIQDSHSGGYASFQQLVEKIDVDLAELLLEREGRHF